MCVCFVSLGEEVSKEIRKAPKEIIKQGETEKVISDKQHQDVIGNPRERESRLLSKAQCGM